MSKRSLVLATILPSLLFACGDMDGTGSLTDTGFESETGTTQATSDASSSGVATTEDSVGTNSDATTEDVTTGKPTTGNPTDSTTEDPTTEDPTTEDPTTEDPTTEDPTTEDPSETSDTGEPIGMVMCGDEPPPDAELAPDLPTYSGVCPTLLTGGESVNAIPGQTTILGFPQTIDRTFRVVVPEDLSDDETLPVIFMWHWLGGDSKGFYDRSEVQDAANFYRFIAVIPDGREIEQGILFKWPFSITDSMEQMEQDFQFFDDMLACVAEQFYVDKECVSSTGVSAGALFTSQLAGGRGDRLSSIISLSGGTGGATVKPWPGTTHKMPAMVLWGGDDDFCIAVDFAQTSKDLEQNLESDGHFMLECVHNCEHATPPFEPPGGLPTYAAMWRFFLDHPYWLEDGQSWYTEEGVPEFYPEWCAIGAGNSDQRVGECGGSEC
ncbi:MAG: hypothetical protein ACPG4T_12465 [Nannocystaceae bacterium]